MNDDVQRLLPCVSEEAARMAHMALMSGATSADDLLERMKQTNPVMHRIIAELSEGMNDERRAGLVMGATVVHSLLEVQVAGEMGERKKQYKR